MAPGYLIEKYLKEEAEKTYSKLSICELVGCSWRKTPQGSAEGYVCSECGAVDLDEPAQVAKAKPKKSKPVYLAPPPRS